MTSKNALVKKVDFKTLNVEIVKAVHWKIKVKHKKPFNDIFLSADLGTNVIPAVIQMYLHNMHLKLTKLLFHVLGYGITLQYIMCIKHRHELNFCIAIICEIKSTISLQKQFKFIFTLSVRKDYNVLVLFVIFPGS